MAKLSVTVCDKCGCMAGPGLAVATYTIEGGGTLAAIDLCEVDAEVVRELQALAPSAPQAEQKPPTPRHTTRHRARVTTIEALEQAKRDGSA